MELWSREDRAWAFQVAPITVGRKEKKTRVIHPPNLMKTQGDRNQRKMGAWADAKVKLEPCPPESSKTHSREASGETEELQKWAGSGPSPILSW